MVNIGSCKAAASEAQKMLDAEKKKKAKLRAQHKSPVRGDSKRGQPLVRRASFFRRNKDAKEEQATPTTQGSSAAKSSKASKSNNSKSSKNSNDQIQEEDFFNLTSTADEPIDENLQRLTIVTTGQDQSCDMSQITMQIDDFKSVQKADDPPLKRLTTLLGECEAIINDSESNGASKSVEHNALFTFQRKRNDGESKIFSTSLNAKAHGDDEESMQDLVKRIQKMGSASGVLKFEKAEIEEIKSGDKQVIFSLVQVNGAKFNKEEFGKMKASEVLSMTTERPILIEILTEEILDDETLDVF
mmetsp:Transcript_19099/g.44501  ORF Transcript_19099/g.44501 Transcript_19099/m.44501 type:complete len:301 (-) Transcript_19099:255-1157(-)